VEKGLWSVAEEALLRRRCVGGVSAFGGWISFAAALLEPVPVPVHLQDVDVMGDAVEQSADVAFNYGNALFNRAKDKDLEIAIQVLKGIDLINVVSQMRHGIALLTVRTLIKTSDWDGADQYLDEIENRLTPESILSFRGLLAYSRGESKKAETFGLEAQKALSSMSGFEVKIFLGRLFVMISRLADALPLFQEAFDANVPSFDGGNLLDCASRMRKDGVVINTFRTLRQRGVNDWGTVSFGVQYLQKYVPQEAVDVLDGFLKDNPDHKLAKLYRSVIGVMSDRAELVNGTLPDIPRPHSPGHSRSAIRKPSQRRRRLCVQLPAVTFQRTQRPPGFVDIDDSL